MCGSSFCHGSGIVIFTEKTFSVSDALTSQPSRLPFRRGLLTQRIRRALCGVAFGQAIQKRPLRIAKGERFLS